MKRYVLAREEERTIGHLRRIVMQREVPDSAKVTLADSSLVIEWTV